MQPKHRILIVGVGSIGQRHVRCYQATGRAVVGVCEPNDALRDSVCEQYAINEATSSLEEAMKSKWDAAVVATPASSHIRIAQGLADCGVHLLIEKPLATSLDGIGRLLRTVDAKRLVAGVAYVYRAHPLLAAMREALLSQQFGQAVQINIVSGQNFPFFRPAYRETYYAHHHQGGGAVQDALTHFINAGEWLVGPITRLAADAAHQVLDGVDVEDTVHVIARHSNVMGCYALNQHQAPNQTTITVNCTGGTLELELHQSRWRWMERPGDPWQDQPSPAMERDEWFTIQCNAFLDAVEHRAPVLCSLREGLQTLRVNLAVLQSASAGAGMVGLPEYDFDGVLL